MYFEKIDIKIFELHVVKFLKFHSHGHPLSAIHDCVNCSVFLFFFFFFFFWGGGGGGGVK
jgi:hypothetical protein